jgi:hypothetical protein
MDRRLPVSQLGKRGFNSLRGRYNRRRETGSNRQSIGFSGFADDSLRRVVCFCADASVRLFENRAGVRSVKLGMAVCVGGPFALVVGIAWLLAPTGPREFWEVLGIGFFLWALFALLTLSPAALRVRLARRVSEDGEDDEWAWRARQRSSALGGLKLVVVLLALLGLLELVNEAAGQQEPGEHGVRVTVPATAELVTLTVVEPDAQACEETGKIAIALARRGEPKVTVGGSVVAPLRSKLDRWLYEIPLSWDRTSFSCYYEFPGIRSTSAPVPVLLYLPQPGSASGSTPEPTRMADGQWGWRCTADRRGRGCAVMGVIDHDPKAILVALALLAGGVLLTSAFSLLVSAVRGLWRGWVSDAQAILAMAWRLARARWARVSEGRA